MIVALLIGSATASAQTFPPLTGRVVDAAHVLSAEQIAALEAESAAIEQASSRQFVIATIPDLEGYPIEDYGYRLGRAWKIGQDGANNGIILIVAPNDRKVRIEVGYGLEPIMTDALSSVIIRDTILPRFKAGDLPGGIIAGANAIAEQMKLPLEAGEARAAALVKQHPAARRQNSAGDWGVAIFIVLVIIFIVLPMMFGRGRGRRYRDHGLGSTVGNVVLWSALNSLSDRGGGSGWGGGGGSDWGGGGGGGFSGGGGSFGGGGSSGSW